MNAIILQQLKRDTVFDNLYFFNIADLVIEILEEEDIIADKVFRDNSILNARKHPMIENVTDTIVLPAKALRGLLEGMFIDRYVMYAIQKSLEHLERK